MKILYIGDNRNRVNWGCRATSKALKDILINSQNEVVSTIDGKETHTSFTRTLYSKKISVKWFKRFENRKHNLVFYPIYKAIVSQGIEKDFLTGNLEKSIEFFEKNYMYFPSLVKIYEDLSKSDAIVINGEGTMIFSTPARRDTLFYLFMLKLGQKLGKKTYLINAMISDCPKTGRNLQTVKTTLEIFAKADAITLRDPLSFRILKEMDTESCVKFEFIPDALFSWRKYFESGQFSPPVIGDSIIPWPEEDQYFGKFDFSKPYICISGSSSAAWTPKEAVGGYIELVKKIKTLGYNVFLVPTCSGDKFLEDVAEATKTPLLPVNMQILIGASILANAEIFISGRFHPSILASLGGTPCIFMGSNSHKNKSLQEMLDYKEIVEFNAIPTASDIEKIFSFTERLLNNKEILSKERNRIKSKVDELSIKTRRILEYIN